jgi:hypothetical protein
MYTTTAFAGSLSNCTATKAFNNSGPILVTQFTESQGISPQYLYESSINIENMLTGTFNGALDNNVLVSCDNAQPNIIEPCYAIPGFDFSGQSTSCNIGNGSAIACTLFKAINDSKPETVRLYTDNYTPNAEGFPADAVVEIQPQVPFNFKYSSDKPSTMSFLAASTADKLFSPTSPVTLTCVPA